MQTPLKTLAEQLVFARPRTDEDARDTLEWVAAREGKTLPQLVAELSVNTSASTVGSAS
jgi:hypothetical protein